MIYVESLDLSSLYSVNIWYRKENCYISFQCRNYNTFSPVAREP